MHSTLGNAVTRNWLEQMRQRRSPNMGSEGKVAAGSHGDIPDQCSVPPEEFRPTSTGTSRDVMGSEFETISFMEPHKKFQSSVSLFQRRPNGWGEPIHTMYP